MLFLVQNLSNLSHFSYAHVFDHLALDSSVYTQQDCYSKPNLSPVVLLCYIFSLSAYTCYIRPFSETWAHITALFVHTSHGDGKSSSVCICNKGRQTFALCVLFALFLEKCNPTFECWMVYLPLGCPLRKKRLLYF